MIEQKPAGIRAADQLQEQAPAVSLPEPLARCVLGLMAVCNSEGIGPSGPELDELLGWIVATYPHLARERDFAWFALNPRA